MADAQVVKDMLRRQHIELPSWAFGNTGTRFKVFAQPGVPRDPFEKVADAAQVHRYTGVAPAVALHIPWDKVDDYAAWPPRPELGVRIGAINANVFQDDDYQLGSVQPTRTPGPPQSPDHLIECVDVMDVTGSPAVKLWFADGTNYPGQDGIRARQDRLAEACGRRMTSGSAASADAARVQAVRARLSTPWTCPTGARRWRTAWPSVPGQCLVDTGHHAPGTNIEFIVAFLAAGSGASAASTSTAASTPTTT